MRGAYRLEVTELEVAYAVNPLINPDPVAVSPLISCDLNSNHVDSRIDCAMI